MKFLLKVAILAAAAKFVLATPNSSQPHSKGAPAVTKREISQGVDTVLTHLQRTLRQILS